jgi:hypothetical protein
MTLTEALDQRQRFCGVHVAAVRHTSSY